ncbi:MAG TPA: trigger factor [Patescibacteria group bacterium]|nr:trigger factor [Patescibacteria group bacterium]
MRIQQEKIKASEIKLTLEVGVDEYRPFLERAAVKLSRQTKIEGFRPGKAPFEIVKNRVGEMNLYQEALDEIVSNFYWQAVMREKLNAVGQPKIELAKLAPGNPIVFTATVGLMPKVELGDYKKIRIKRQPAAVKDEEVDQAIDDLRGMRAKEVLVNRPAQKNDQAEIDFNVSLDKVPVEGGQGQKYPLVLGSGAMIPGFEDNLIGLKAGEEKIFQLKFPAEYQNKMLAGKLCDFKVKVHSVFERQLPEATDDWAKTLGAESVKELKTKITKNLEEEKKFNEEQRLENELLEKIVARVKFSEIPDSLIHNEAHRMVHEFGDTIAARGISFADYLKNIKKEEHDLEEEFAPRAKERVKTSIVIKEIADQEKIEATADELKKETELILAQVPDNQEAADNIKSEGYQQYLNTIVRNKKVMEMLKKECIN